MTRVALPALSHVVIGGLDISAAAQAAVAAGGNTFGNNGRQKLAVTNSDSGSHSVIFKSYPRGNTPDGLTVSDLTVPIPAGKTMVFGPFPPSIWNDNSDLVNMDWSAVTSVTAIVFDAVNDPN